MIGTAPEKSAIAETHAVRKRLILIVDDLPENLQVLAGHLNEEGHEVIAANNGARAIALVRNRKPDLILLDVMMPGMDGFEVCKILKEDPESADIPIIFLTAKTETLDVVEGFRMGAVDYVAKPFKSPELVARVRTHLELKSSRDLLYAYNRQLERITTRLKRLNEDKNRFLGIVSHDIRGAFGNVVNVSRMITDEGFEVDGEATEFLREIGVEAEHMISLAENLLNIDAIERRDVRLKREPVDTAAVVEFALNAHRMAARTKGIEFTVDTDDSFLIGDLTGCRQILSNLTSNAVKFSPRNSKVKIGIRRVGDKVAISVTDNGPGISAEDQKKLFQPFTRLGNSHSSGEHSVGLGLSIVKLMSDAMGGTVRCESSPSQGASFTVSLPVAL